MRRLRRAHSRQVAAQRERVIHHQLGQRRSVLDHAAMNGIRAGERGLDDLSWYEHRQHVARRALDAKRLVQVEND